MKFFESVKELARRFDKSSDLAKFRAIAEPALNLAYLDVGKSWRWPQLEVFGSILAVPKVEGSVSITNGSYTVTISGASLDWIGRFFREKGGENNYRILFVSGNDLTLDQPIAEDTGTVDYEIEKRFYTLPTEVREFMAFDSNPDKVMGLENRGLRQTMPNYDPRTLDVPFVVAGTDNFTGVYSTGTATTTKDSAVVNFSGSSLLGNVRPGNIFEFSSVEYRVRRVESNLRMVLYNLVSSPASGAFKIYQDNPKTVRLRGTFTKNKVIPFSYIRTVYPMIHDDDRIELSEEAIIAILSFAEANLAKSLGKDDWANRLLEAQARLRAAQENASPVNAAYKQLSPLIPRGLGRG